jgi:hypothetical protein
MHPMTSSAVRRLTTSKTLFERKAMFAPLTKFIVRGLAEQESIRSNSVSAKMFFR